MKKALFAGLAAALLCLTASNVQAQQAANTSGSKSVASRMENNNRFTLGAEWFSETIRNKTAGTKGHGGWGGVVGNYDYKEGGNIYGGLQARYAWGKVGGQRGTDWNGVGRIGYGWDMGATQSWFLAPYLGAGYESQRIRFTTSSRVYFWYIPVGIMLDYRANPNFMVGLKAEYGFMAGAKYKQYVATTGKISAGNRARYEIEVPFTYIFTDFSNGHFDISLVPFWHGWRTGQKTSGAITAPRLTVDMYGARLDFGWRF